MSDGFCLIRVGPVSREKRTTEIKPQAVSAVWESRYVFDNVELSDGQFESEKLSLEVWNKNDFSKNTLIGTALHQLLASGAYSCPVRCRPERIHAEQHLQAEAAPVLPEMGHAGASRRSR
jgi:hypothetical protein